MIYGLNDCPINEEVWFCGIKYDDYVDWLESDDIPKPVFNCRPTIGKLINLGDTVEFRCETSDVSIRLNAFDRSTYIFADTFEEAAQEYNNVIYKYHYKLRMMTRDLNFYRIKNTEGVY